MDSLKGFVVIFNDPNDKYCMVSDGTVKLEDLQGHKGVFIRETVYKALELTLWQRFALWLFGFDGRKDASRDG